MNWLKQKSIIDEARQKGLYSALEHDSCGLAFIVHMKGKKSHDIVQKALTALGNLEHRGACGCEANTGDGAGILIQIPHEFLARECSSLGIKLPEAGQYGTGCLFLPQDPEEQKKVKAIVEKIIRDQGQTLLGWRDVPTDCTLLGQTARDPMPVIQQIFIAVGPSGPGLPGEKQDAFERRLFIIRKFFENAVAALKLKNPSEAYFPSLSSRTLIYKGMLISHQLQSFYPDLSDAAIKSAIALVHSRFSTNTFPNWNLAHPFRYLCHNGEINTLRGNINWMRAREALCASPLLGNEIKKIFPICIEGASDSAIFDNVLELLVMGGYSLPHAMMMMIPEAWDGHKTMAQEKKDFYEYNSCLMEPWDGPASMAFTDGRVVGAVLDRNGLRPSRYYVTKDDLVIMASEVGVIEIAPQDVRLKERLHPGRMFLVDLAEGRIIDDQELKAGLCKAKPYGQWLKEQMLTLEDLPAGQAVLPPDHATILHQQLLFGYTLEDEKILLAPMARDGQEAVGSMGNDAPLAVLTERPQPLFHYFKQLFAQVTNPPLDAIREELVTSVDTTIGSEGNLLQPSPQSVHHIRLHSPILDNQELAKLKNLATSPMQGFRSITLPLLFETKKAAAGLEQSLNQLFKKVDEAIENNCNILILSDRGVDHDHAPIPSLLATAGLHHHLVANGKRTRVALVVESGEPREVHHFCLLVGYGAGAICPYLAFDTLDDLIRDKVLENLTLSQAVKNYSKAVKKGIVKVMSKIGISTIQSYRGAQIFEAIGLNRDFIDRYFTHTASRIGGIGLSEICEETLKRHQKAFPERYSGVTFLDWGGEYQWRRNSISHLLNPDTVAKLQYATSANHPETYEQYAKAVNEQAGRLCTLRGLIQFKPGNPVPLGEVEEAKSIVKRFKTGAMSYGSISKEAHETLAIAMNRIGGKSNTGEGGEDPMRYQLDENGDSRNSAIKQVASGRFGVTAEYLTQSKELQIKIAQGAKPGEGGQLPGHKVYPWIAKVRLSTPGVGLISPPPHHDIYSIEDLAQLIFDLKNSNPGAAINVKLVSEIGVGTIAAGVAKAHADVILIAGHDGGTGASPLTSIKHAGSPWELGLAETQQTLVINRLRDRVTLEVDGQMKTGRDVVIGALLGAEEFGFATAPLVSMGCIMMRVCHLNTCPVGIATQDPVLRKKFTGTPDAVVRFLFFVAEEMRRIMAQLGFKTVGEMIGRSDMLDFNHAVTHWKTKGLDFSPIFYKPDMGPDVAVRKVVPQDHGLGQVLDRQLVKLCKKALDRQEPVSLILPIRNINRTTGTLLGHELTKRYGATGLPDNTIQIKFEGSAGQSFGAFIPKGLSLTLEGDANDYCGKGLSGGRIIVFPPKKSTFIPEENILIGNVALYGSTSGEAFFRGIAGERFCVRNSGVHAVVEGVGDHGCEYMTGGRVLVLGKTGRNFAAGMSGGIAFVYDNKGIFSRQCNADMVDLDPLDVDDAAFIQGLITKHVQFTGSEPGQRLLQNFAHEVQHFIKVMPKDYKAALVEIRARMAANGISEMEAMYG